MFTLWKTERKTGAEHLVRMTLRELARAVGLFAHEHIVLAALKKGAPLYASDGTYKYELYAEETKP